MYARARMRDIAHNKSCPLFPNVYVHPEVLFFLPARGKAIITRSLSKMNAPAVTSRVKIAEVIEICDISLLLSLSLLSQHRRFAMS